MNKTFRLSTISLLLIFSLLTNISTAYTQPGNVSQVVGPPQPVDTLYPGLRTPRGELPPGISPEWWEVVSRDLDIPNTPNVGDYPTPNVDWTRDGYINNNRGGRFGYSVDSAGDVNNDGYDDVIVGAPFYFNNYTNQGRAYVYLGSETGLSTSYIWTYGDTDFDGYAHFGLSAGSAGDFNCDGYDDIIVGAYQYSGAITRQGYAMVFFGKSAATGSLNTSPGWTVTGSASWERYGSSVSTAGDVNGDTCDDIIVGAEGWDTETGPIYEGAAFVYHGGTNPDTAYEWWVHGDQYDPGLGTQVDTAGDVNNDGYDDIILGLPSYSTGGRIWVYYGSINGLSNGAVTGTPSWSIVAAAKSISTAGDVNGDGFDDIIYGDEGTTVYAYYGSSSGLSTTANWSNDCGLATDEYWSGFGVSEAGDVNNDGYDDVLVAAPSYPYEQIAGPGQYKGEGYVYFFYGSGDGLYDTPTWSMKGNQREAILGEWEALGAAGDVNNDGYDDMIIGSPGTDISDVIGVGRAYAVYGEADSPITGLAVVSNTPVEIDQTVSFTATITAGSYVSYDWDFGDVSTAQNAGAQVEHVYAAAGTYTTTVIANNIVNTQTATTLVTVTDTPISGLIASNDSPTALGETTVLTAEISAGSNVTYTWDMGDGVIKAGKDVTHTYLTSGEFTAWVTATNTIDQQVVSTMVYIEDSVTGLTASNDGPTALGGATALSAEISTGTNVTYTWNLGDDVIKLGKDILHTYGNSGVFTAVVTATNPINQQVASTTIYIEESITGLTAINDGPTALGEPTVLSANVSTGTNLTYTWNLGGGIFKFGKDVIHTYTSTGEYTAVVTATNPVDQQITATTVYIDIPITGLTAVNDSPMMVGGLTTLTATITSGTNVSYLWAFSNGGTSTNRVTTHLFGAVGIHSATVTATNSLGSHMAVTEIMIGEAVTLSVGTETYTTSDGTLNLHMPTTLTETLTITYTPLTVPSQSAGGFLFAGQSFHLSMADGNGDPIIELKQPITLTLYYDESGLPDGTDEALLTLQRYDTDTSNWVELTVIERDITANYIAVSLDHLSEFALLLEAQHKIFLPLVNR